MGFELLPDQKEEMGRFSSRYLPDAMNNNHGMGGMGIDPESVKDFDSAKDVLLRADKFIKDNNLNIHGSSIRQFGTLEQKQQWTAIANPPREEGRYAYNRATNAERTDIARYAMAEANNLQGERVMLQSMGLDLENTGALRDKSYGSFSDMIYDPVNRDLRPTDAEIARFEELTSFDNNGKDGNTDHSAEAVASRLRVPEQNREAFAQFRDEYLADRGLEYNTLEHGERVVEPEGTEAGRREAAEEQFRAEHQKRLAQQPQQGFSQRFGGMADGFVAEHNAAQERQQQQQSGRGFYGRTTESGFEFG